MNLTNTQKLSRFSSRIFQGFKIRSGAVYMGMIVAALLAFEVFNFSSTNFALGNIFGSQSSGGVSWSTILALAFCGMDFAGIARLLEPQEEKEGRMLYLEMPQIILKQYLGDSDLARSQN